MRTAAALIATLVVGGASVFLWQRSQIAGLREQVSQQGAALEDSRERIADLSLAVTGASGQRLGAPAFPATATREVPLRSADYDAAVLRADERRVIVGQYRDVLAQLNLPVATASRLEDLLADRIEAFLDAQDAAVREGFAEGSEETQRAVALAIADDDRRIADLLGPDSNRRLNRLLFAPATDTAVAAEPAAPPVVVNVVVQAPAAPYYPDETAQPAAAYDSTPSPYYYFPSPGFFAVGAPGRPYLRGQPATVRPHRGPPGVRAHRG